MLTCLPVCHAFRNGEIDSRSMLLGLFQRGLREDFVGLCVLISFKVLQIVVFFCCILGCVCGWRLIDRHWFSWDSLYAVLNMRFVFRSNFNETVLTRTFLKRNLYRSREICFSHFCLDFCHVYFQRVKKRFLFSTLVASCVKCVLIVARTFKNSQ